LNCVTVEHEQPSSQAHALPFPKVVDEWNALAQAFDPDVDFVWLESLTYRMA
jgi:hypothetical protein